MVKNQGKIPTDLEQAWNHISNDIKFSKNGVRTPKIYLIL